MNTPDTHNTLCLADAGLETWLIFKRNFELNDFASFELLATDDGRALLDEYFEGFIELADELDLGLVLETPTWRANPDWGARLGRSSADLAAINRQAVDALDRIRKSAARPQAIYLSGNIGPRGDGYVAGEVMSVDEAQQYHAPQVEAFAQTRADLVSAFTMTNVPEAMGIVRAAGEADIPCVISFTVETDGRLPTGQTLRSAIEQMDASTFTRPLYYMVNCAHPDHFAGTLEERAPWLERIKGIRANASRMSHAELDACEVLDEGDATELGHLYRNLANALPALAVVGGCCGTDHNHVSEIAHALKQERER